MRILYFSPDLSAHDVRFLTAISPFHEVCHLKLGPASERASGCELPAAVRELSWKGSSGATRGVEALLHRMTELEKILSDVQPDLVQAGPIPSCAFMTALAGFRPLLAVSWGSDLLVESQSSPWMQWITQYTLKRASLLLCDADAVRQVAQSTFSLPPDRILQMPWGTDLAAFSPGPPGDLRERLGWGDDFVVLSTRFWEPPYGIETTLEAFRLFRARSPRARLILLGTGSLAPMVHQFIGDHDLGRDVHLPGAVAPGALPGFFRSADVYLSCSRSDGTSVSLLEALATGLPVVVSDIPGNREWVATDVNGWLAPAGDIPAFSEALGRAARLSPDGRAAIAKSNRGLVERRADWQGNIARLLQAYLRLPRDAS